MPKGRGSNSRSSKRSTDRSKGKRPAVGAASSSGSSLKGLAGAVQVTAAEMRKRAQAKEAGGFTRDERRRSRQRQEEAARLAARRMAKAINEQSGQ